MNHLKKLSFCYKIWFSNPNIFSTWCCMTSDIANYMSVRLNSLSLKYKRFRLFHLKSVLNFSYKFVDCNCYHILYQVIFFYFTQTFSFIVKKLIKVMKRLCKYVYYCQTSHQTLWNSLLNTYKRNVIKLPIKHIWQNNITLVF